MNKPTDSDKIPEAEVLKRVRLEATRSGLLMWRNNVGAVTTEDGRHIRFGLCNDSPAVNARMKSSDLIGLRPVTITQEMVGHVIGQLVTRETKRQGWHYRGTPEEQAQRRFMDLVNLYGGDARFCTGEGSF